MKNYSNMGEINQDLKRLGLERQIALEELKGLKHDVKQDFSPYNWLGTLASFVKKYGMMYLIKKLIR